jgi:2,3-bisphosphoglycerate-independent phosphoglycerate mutase
MKRKSTALSPQSTGDSATPGTIGTGALSLAQAVRKLYGRQQTDYSLEPIVLTDSSARPVGRIKDGDAVIFCCRRGEREIQLTEAFTAPEFDHFKRPLIKDLIFIPLTLYHDKFKGLPVAFAPKPVKKTLGEVISRAGLRQLHMSESEKFAHVTFFLNGGNNQSFGGEEDICVPSPKGVPYDQVPELSLPQVAAQVLRGINNLFDFIAVNFANGDVIGHTTNIAAKISCATQVDKYLGQVLETARAAGYVTFITADHGNLEEMLHPDGSPHVAHTSNPVPFLLIDPAWSATACLRDGKLADLAPTVLAALGLEQPKEMDGTTLAPSYAWGQKRRVLLIILDGWGIGKKDETNPIHIAHPPVWNDLIRNYPLSLLQASGEAVGLGAGKAGNSEAGHMNIGAGRVVLQDDVRLEHAMQDGTFNTNEIFLDAIKKVKERGTNLHLIGLLSEKSSHGSIDYPLALLKLARASALKNVFLHLIFDGRSTEPGSAPDMLEKLDEELREIGTGQIVTGVGRGIALDRDGNYDRTKVAYDALVYGSENKQSVD